MAGKNNNFFLLFSFGIQGFIRSFAVILDGLESIRVLFNYKSKCVLVHFINFTNIVCTLLVITRVISI